MERQLHLQLPFFYYFTLAEHPAASSQPTRSTLERREHTEPRVEDQEVR